MSRPRPPGVPGPVLLVGALLVAALVVWWGWPGGSPTSVTPAAVTPGSVTPAAVTPAAVTPAAVTPTSARTATTRTAASARTATTRTAASATPVTRSGDLRAKARAVLAVVDATGRGPKGYVGGRRFMNDGRGGTAPLPRTSAGGAPVVYHEYDVNPYREGVNRGPQRLVVGDDGSAYCTPDHYESWIRLR